MGLKTHIKRQLNARIEEHLILIQQKKRIIVGYF